MKIQICTDFDDYIFAKELSTIAIMRTIMVRGLSCNERCPTSTVTVGKNASLTERINGIRLCAIISKHDLI